MTEFAFPEIYNFPPFFTLQPNVNTRRQQLSAWCALLLAYTKHHRIWVLDLQEAGSSPLFHNAAKQRRLSLEGIYEVATKLAEAGQAEWVGGNSARGRLFVWWRSPAEWAALVVAHVQARGLQGQVCTVYELREGEDTVGAPFHLMAPAAFARVLETLEAQGQARAFATQGGDQGVKFS